MSPSNDWRNWEGRESFTYQGLNDPQYIKDRDKMFEGNNGWWWGDGWWNGKHETPMEKMRRYREERGT